MRKNTRITVQAGAPEAGEKTTEQSLSARVVWTQKSRRLAGMYQVGIEFDTPQDLWHIQEIPENWNAFYSPAREESVSFSTEIEGLLQLAHAGMYCELLGVQADTPRIEIRRQFYRLARRFHPDRHMDHPDWTPRLLLLMDSLTVAYKALAADGAMMPLKKECAGKQEAEMDPQAQECLTQAESCLTEKNYVGSILWLRRAVEVEPRCSKYRAMLGRSLAAVPEYRHEAIEQFERAIELDSLNVDAHFQYAQLLEQANFSWRARSHYARVLEIDALHAQARERMSHIDVKSPRSTSRASLLSRLTGRR
jgi:tetratricopeptide (TPR) repeat protein